MDIFTGDVSKTIESSDTSILIVHDFFCDV